MLGFADICDLDILTLQEIAQRLGYKHTASLRRYLSSIGASPPPSLRRGKYRGDHVKAWFVGLHQADAHTKEGRPPAHSPNPPAAQPPNIYQFPGQAEMRAKLAEV